MAYEAVKQGDGRRALAPREVAEALEGIVEAEDLAAHEAGVLTGAQVDLLGRADRLLAARERLGLGIGVPPVRIEALSQMVGDLMRLLAAKRPRELEDWRRRRGLPSLPA